jgi:glyoxylase-like metal-dependent hydrolase (beta-lactamase superfamily II)
MIFRQMFDAASGTYSYLLASRIGGEALIIDPVLEKVDRYIQLLNELNLRLVKAIDTHLHADHITGLTALRDRTDCITVMGEQSKADIVSLRVNDGDKLDVDGLSLGVIYTPGHTDDSYSFAMADRVFTGDTLLIRGTGRTDFQNGDPRAQYESIFNRLLKLPDQTLVYPAHGAGSLCSTGISSTSWSTIGYERRHDPLLQPMEIDAFARALLGGQPTVPRYFARMRPMNQAGPPLLGGVVPEITPLSGDGLDGAHGRRHERKVRCRWRDRSARGELERCDPRMPVEAAVCRNVPDALGDHVIAFVALQAHFRGSEVRGVCPVVTETAFEAQHAQHLLQGRRSRLLPTSASSGPCRIRPVGD